MSKKILITGGAGFIFSNFIRQSFYNKKEYNIASLDKISDDSFYSVYINANHSFYICDVCDDRVLNILLKKEKPDLVIHGAAETSVDKSIKNPSSFIRNNIEGTQNVINACLSNNCSLLYISTDQVYGPSRDSSSFYEEDRLNPKNVYSMSKASGEELVRIASLNYGLDFNIVRVCDNYGPWQTADKFIPKIISCILKNESIPIYGDGCQERSWIHVYDTCSALFMIIDKWSSYQTYNLSAGQEYSNLEIAQFVCNSIGSGHSLISHVKDRVGHDARYLMNTSKILSKGWKPSFKLKDGINDVCEWYLDNNFFIR